MKKEYDAFIDKPLDLPQGQEVELTIRDLAPGPRKYRRRKVTAVVSRSPAQMPDGDVLWVRHLTGIRESAPWAIEIKQEIDGFVHKPPHWANI